MASSASTSRNSARRALHGTPYETIQPGRPPIPITVAPTPSSAQLDLHPSLRSTASHEPVEHVPASLSHGGESQRVSDLALSQLETQEPATSGKDPLSLRKMSRPGGSPATLRSPRTYTLNSRSPGNASHTGGGARQATSATEGPFMGLSTNIPSISFEDLTTPGGIEFSKRGSILIGGKRASETYGKPKDHALSNSLSREAKNSCSTPRRVLSQNEEALSRRVRSMYDSELVHVARRDSYTASFVNVPETSIALPSIRLAGGGQHLEVPQSPLRVEDSTRNPESFRAKGVRELAGGMEDWEDLHGGDVDRYGFISRQIMEPSNMSSSSLPVSPSAGLHRVSTILQLVSETPRRRYSRLGRTSSMAKSSKSVGTARGENGSKVLRPSSSQSSYRSTTSVRTSRIRVVSNRLPHNRERRLVDEAGNMLTLPSGLADIAEHEEGGKTADMHRRKEWEREAKWRKMAKIENKREHGGGMVFSFDTTSPKLVERTWKGIPDRWRATAWYSFLAASAKKAPGSVSDQDLVVSFRDLVVESSPDDVQIDIDVPRTISGHVMFRKRYRGGQRLLFRVLHCLSLFFPNTGYVQGMAALAATLLCYFDEEMAFVMLVRMWQLRGLERLYKPGFEGLMQALQEFEGKWLKNGAIGMKLVSRGRLPIMFSSNYNLSQNWVSLLPPTVLAGTLLFSITRYLFLLN